MLRAHSINRRRELIPHALPDREHALARRRAEPRNSEICGVSGYVGQSVMSPAASPLSQFQPAVARWFESAFSEPTRPQVLGWPAIARRQSTLIFAPTGTGKTLAAFLACIDRLMF